MSQKLTIVVPCTDRKSQPTAPSLHLRSVPRDHATLTAWTDRIDSAKGLIPLRQLYQGEAWSQVPRLEESARRIGFDPTVYVASAGLGLQPLTAMAPAYGATFSPRHADSVDGSVTQQRAWWNGLNEWNGSLGALPTDSQVLFVLSQRYADVLSPLVNATAQSRPTLVVGGSGLIDSAVRLPADAELRAELGGTRGGLNMRTAVAWLERLSSPSINEVRDHEAWRAWAAGVARRERYARATLSDNEVRAFIRRLRSEIPGISKTRALRALRDSGHACEQHRFTLLFGSTSKGDR